MNKKEFRKLIKREYIDNKKSTTQIAKEIGCSHSTILIYLKKYNIPRRTISEAMKGSRHPNFKNGDCLKEIHCIDCGKKLSKYAYYYGNVRCIACSNKGKNNGNYINGKSLEIYPSEYTFYLRRKIRERDNFICQGENCSMTEEEHLIIYGKVLFTHHIDYDKQNCEEENLITLCQKCNLIANYNRDYWKEYYNEKLFKEKMLVC